MGSLLPAGSTPGSQDGRSALQAVQAEIRSHPASFSYLATSL